jgi:hypothetical protein
MYANIWLDFGVTAATINAREGAIMVSKPQTQIILLSLNDHERQPEAAPRHITLSLHMFAYLGFGVNDVDTAGMWSLNKRQEVELGRFDRSALALLAW